MKTRVENRIAGIRKGRGLSASGLARLTGVSRQTIYAIEAGHVRSQYRSGAADRARVGSDGGQSLLARSGTAATASRRRHGSAQRRRSAERPAGAHLPRRRARGLRSGQPRAVLHARSRRDRPAKHWNPCRCRRVRGRRSGSEAARARRMRSRHQHSGEHGGKGQRYRGHLRRGVEQAGTDVAETGQGPRGRLAPRRPGHRGIQPAVHSPRISGRRLHRGHVRSLAGGTGRREWESEKHKQHREPVPQKRALRQSRTRFRQPRPRGQAARGRGA